MDNKHQQPSEKEEKIIENDMKIENDSEENDEESFYDNWEEYFLDSCRYK